MSNHLFQSGAYLIHATGLMALNTPPIAPDFTYPWIGECLGRDVVQSFDCWHNKIMIMKLKWTFTIVKESITLK